jgi:hypothetical protein
MVVNELIEKLNQTKNKNLEVLMDPLQNHN